MVNFSPIAAPEPKEEASVIVIAHPDSRMLGHRFRLAPGEALEIGRALTSAVALPEILSVSRSHARISFADGSVSVEDLRSTNGTYVNDRKIRSARALKSGDRIQVGTVLFKLLRGSDVEHAYHQAIHELAIRDGLTEIFNKRKFDEEAEREFLRSRRYGRPLSLIAFDLDHFKAINDTSGHMAGDFVLKQVAQRVSAMIRAEQVFARVGGEEFAILCPEAETAKAALLAEKLRIVISDEPCKSGRFSVVVTASFGIGAASPEMQKSSELYEAADRALYQSKKLGRNRVTPAPRPIPVG